MQKIQILLLSSFLSSPLLSSDYLSIQNQLEENEKGTHKNLLENDVQIDLIETEITEIFIERAIVKPIMKQLQHQWHGSKEYNSYLFNDIYFPEFSIVEKNLIADQFE